METGTPSIRLQISATRSAAYRFLVSGAIVIPPFRFYHTTAEEKNKLFHLCACFEQWSFSACRLSRAWSKEHVLLQGPEAMGKSIQPGIVGVLAQIVLDLSGQDQLQVFQRGVVDEVVQCQSGDGSLIDKKNSA